MRFAKESVLKKMPTACTKSVIERTLVRWLGYHRKFLVPLNVCALPSEVSWLIVEAEEHLDKSVGLLVKDGMPTIESLRLTPTVNFWTILLEHAQRVKRSPSVASARRENRHFQLDPQSGCSVVNEHV